MIPLYADHSQDQLNTRPLNGHAGLWFERFFNQYNDEWVVKDTGKRAFLDSLAGYHAGQERSAEGAGRVGAQGLLDRHAEQVAELAEGQGGLCFAMQSSWHFATGLGNPHPVENGLSWHPVLGVPYLPGSAVKGLARAWLELNGYDAELRKRLFGSDHKDPQQAKSFDNEPELVAGEVIFFDALPLEPVSLGVDVMTPHMGKWYEQGHSSPGKAETTPADWHSPVPVPFLVARQVVLQFAVAPRRPESAQLAELASQALRAALENLGAGAKTAAGYGAFVDLDEKRQKLQEQRRKAREAETEERAERAAMAALSEYQRTLEKLKQEAELPANQEAGSGAEFHRRIGELLKEADDWPDEDARELASFARTFFKRYGSKKRQKEMGAQIRKLLGEG